LSKGVKGLLKVAGEDFIAENVENLSSMDIKGFSTDNQGKEFLEFTLGKSVLFEK
jgi:hypothetical protein